MSPIKKIIRKLIYRNISISIAESCTGGLITNNLIKISGISKIFSCGIICYSNKSKERYLSISKKKLTKFGAVSPEVAEAMINNLYKKEKTKLTISTTGIAGPRGGSREKPVGLVYIGIRYKNRNLIFKKNYKGSRMDIQRKTMNFIFKEIEKLI